MRQAALTEETNRSRPLQNSCAAAKEPPTSSSTPFSTPPVLSPFLLLVSSLSPLLLLLPPPPFLVYKTQVERVIRRRNVFIRSLRNKSKFLISLSYELQRHWSTRICSLLGVQHGADAGRGKKSRPVVIIYYYYYYYLLYLFLVQEEMKGKKQKKKSFLLLLLFKRKDGHRRLGPFFHARFHAVRRAIWRHSWNGGTNLLWRIAYTHIQAEQEGKKTGIVVIFSCPFFFFFFDNNKKKLEQILR